MERHLKRALLIGINDYEKVKKLNGCVNDINRVEKILLSFEFDEILVLRDREATRTNILAGLDKFANLTQSNEYFFFYFSGHGSEVRNEKKDNGYNETIVPYDGNGREDIKDDEIRELLKSFRSRNLALVFDSCHSGDITRDPHHCSDADNEVIRGVPPPDEQLEDIMEFTGSRGIEYQGAHPKTTGGGWFGVSNFVVLSACRDRQVAAERYFNDVACIHGILTYHLCTILETYDRRVVLSIPWRGFYLQIRDAFGTRYTQEPQLEGLRDWSVFGTNEISVERHATIKSKDAERVLQAGFLHGISSHSRWQRYQLTSSTNMNQANMEASASLRQVEDVESYFATSDLFRDINAVKCMSSYFEQPTKVWVNLPLLEKIETNIRDSLSTSLYIEIVYDDYDYLIGLQNGDIMLQDNTGRALESFRSTTNDWELFCGNLNKLAFHNGILHCMHDRSRCQGINTTEVEFSLVISPRDHVNAPETHNHRPIPFSNDEPIILSEGDLFYFVFKNYSTQPLFVTLIEFYCSFGIQIIYPPAGGHGAAVKSTNGSVSMGYKEEDYILVLTAPADAERADDGSVMQYFRLIVTGAPSDFSMLAQESIVSAHIEVDRSLGRRRSIVNVESSRTGYADLSPIPSKEKDMLNHYLVQDIKVIINPRISQEH